MADETPKAEELITQIDHRPPGTGWMDTPVHIRKGMYCYAANPKSVDTLSLPNDTRMKHHVNPWNYPVKVHTYDAYEDEFRDKMIEAGLPVEKESVEPAAEEPAEASEKKE